MARVGAGRCVGEARSGGGGGCRPEREDRELAMLSDDSWERRDTRSLLSAATIAPVPPAGRLRIDPPAWPWFRGFKSTSSSSLVSSSSSFSSTSCIDCMGCRVSRGKNPSASSADRSVADSAWALDSTARLPPSDSPGLGAAPKVDNGCFLSPGVGVVGLSSASAPPVLASCRFATSGLAMPVVGLDPFRSPAVPTGWNVPRSGMVSDGVDCPLLVALPPSLSDPLVSSSSSSAISSAA